MGIYKASQGIIELDEEAFCGNVVPPQISNILSQVLIALGRAPDVQRGITRIFHRTATASEFVAVIGAVLVAGKQLQQLHLEDDENNAKKQGKTVKSTLLRRLILTASSSSFVAHAMKLLSALDKDAATRGDLQNLFIVSSGQFSEVFRCHTAVQVAKEKLDLLISQYRKQLGMRNLEFTSVSGSTHLIELPSNVRVPSNWVKVSSTKKAIRYHPPEVLTALDGLMLAKEELVVACKATWNDFLTGFGEYYAEFQAVVQALAALDCLHSLATLSRNPNYVCPDFLDDDVPGQIQICSGRHPVLELILGDNFVPNDTKLHTDGEFCQIITGPNMGGKSCYIRQVALIAIMAQVGSFVPALSAKLHVVDGIYTRMGASDSIHQGSSTFYEELSEACHILQKCSSHSLVIIDELGRGTSTHDGVAIAYATLHFLLEQKRCMVLFVTHYPEMMNIQEKFPGCVGAYHVSYMTTQKSSMSDLAVDPMENNDVTFLYKVVEGASDKSFGINVACLAQLPYSCITRAAVMAAKLEAELSARVKSRIAGKPSIRPFAQTEGDMTHGNHCNLMINGKDNLGEFNRPYARLFHHLQFAFSNSDPMKIMGSLKEAKELAMKMLEGCAVSE